MFKSQKNRGFTLAELAASLGVFALAATILTPAFAGVTATSETMVTVSEENLANVSPFTPPVDSILIDVKDTSGNLVKQAVVNDPTATTTTVTGLDANKDYTFEVVKKNQAGQSPAAVAQVVYTKVGERVEPRTRIIQVPDATRPIWADDTTRPIMANDTARPIMANDTARPTAWAQKVTGYQKKTISVPGFIQNVAEQRNRQVQKTREVRVAPFERQVRVAPFERQVRIAPFERQVRVAPFSRSVRVAPFERQVTVSCTKQRTESYVCGSRTYSYSCGTTTSCSGSGRNRRCTTSTRWCTASEPRYCTRTVNYQSTCTSTQPVYNYRDEAVYNYRTEAVYNYRTEAVYNYRTEAAYNYRTETYMDTETWVHTYSLPAAEGTCANASHGSYTGVVYTCTSTTVSKSVDDTSRPIYADDKSKPIAWAQKVVGYHQKKIGYQQKVVGHQLMDAVDNYTVTLDVKKGITAAQSVKASPGQLLLDASSVKTVNRAWKEATIAASGSNKAVGSKVKFTTGQLVTLNGKQYIAVASAATR
jgi:hypothetical protein